MSDAATDTAQAPQAGPVLPKGAYESFLALAGLCFAAMCCFVFLYGLYGPAVTAGLDRACAEASFEAGKKLERLGNYDQAVQYFRRAMEGHFNDPERRYMCGRSIGDLLFHQQRYAEAIDAYEQLPSEAFASAGAWSGYVTSLWMDGHSERAQTLALEWLGKSEAQGNSEQVLWANNVLMRVAEKAGRLEEALERGRAMTAIDPGSGAHLVMANILRALDRREEALAHCSTFLSHSSSTKLRDDAQRLRNAIAAEM